MRTQPEPPRVAMTRRTFLAGAGLATALLATGCDPKPSIPSPSVPLAANDWDRLRAARAALRASPDHLVAQAGRLIAAGDESAIIAFVRDNITIDRVWAGDKNMEEARFGPYAVLRSGRGTPHEATLLAQWMLAQVGRASEVGFARGVGTDSPRLTSGTRASFAPGDGLAELRRIDVPREGRATLAYDQAVADDLARRITAAGTPRKADVDATAPTGTPFLRVDGIDGDNALSLFTDSAGYQRLSSSGIARPRPNAIEVALLGVSTLDEQPVTLVSGSWPADQVEGRSIVASFTPVAELMEMLSLPMSRFRAFTPSLRVVGADQLDSPLPEHPLLPGTTPAAEEVFGDTVTLDARTVSSTSPQQIEGIDGAGGDPASVDDVVVHDVATGGWPWVRLVLDALTSAGAPVVGLGPDDVIVTAADGTRRIVVLERNRPAAPRIEFVVDHSGSVAAPFRGEALPTLVRRIAEGIGAQVPDAQFAVRVIGEEDPATFGIGLDEIASRSTPPGHPLSSDMWGALAAAAADHPAVTVLVGDTTDGGDGSAMQHSRIGHGPRTVIVAIPPGGGELRQAQAVAGLTGGVVLRPTDVEPAVSAAVDAVIDATRGVHQLRVDVPGDGPSELTVTIGTAHTTVTCEPPELRAAAPQWIGIRLSVTANGMTSTRTIAGIPTSVRVRDVTAQQVEPWAAQTRRAFFAATELVVEGPPPTTAVMLDELLTQQLSMEPLEALATAGGDADAAAEALAGIQSPDLLRFALSSVDPSTGSDGPTTALAAHYLQLTTHRLVPGDDGELSVTGIDLLPNTRWRTASADAAQAWDLTVRRTARLAHIEAIEFVESALVFAKGELRVPGSTRELDEATAALVERWQGSGRAVLLPVTPGARAAGFSVDERTGTVHGIVADRTAADASGGGESVANINALYDRLNGILGRASTLGGMIKCYAIFMKAYLGQLRVANIAIATLGDADAPVADPGRAAAAAACDTAAGEVAGAIGGVVESATGAVEAINDTVDVLGTGTKLPTVCSAVGLG